MHAFSIRSIFAPCQLNRRHMKCISSTRWFVESPQPVHRCVCVYIYTHLHTIFLGICSSCIRPVRLHLRTVKMHIYQTSLVRTNAFLNESLTFGWPLETQSWIQQPTSTNQNQSRRFSQNINTDCTFNHMLLSHYETQQHPQMNDFQQNTQLNLLSLFADQMRRMDLDNIKEYL